jgi:hypothetical protein
MSYIIKRIDNLNHHLTRAMDTSQDGAAANEQGKRQGLITVNDLSYVLEPDLSVAVNKTTKKHFFQSTSYDPSQNGICIFNSGADYIDTRRSFLSFQIQLNAPVTANGYFGTHGSACNVIDNITISTRSGDEIARITDFNLLSNMMIPLTYDEEWCKTVGGPMGYSGVVLSAQKRNEINAANPFTVPPQRFNIPMYVLAPFFGYGRLMPAMVMSGLRVEIGFAQPDVAFLGGLDESIISNPDSLAPASVNRVLAVTGYTVENAYFSLCSVQLSDSIQRALNEQSATNGLEIVYTDYEKTESSYQGAATNCNIEVRKSCSRALKAFARVRCHVDETPSGKKDSFRSEKGFPWLEYQWQLGSLYFPQQPVKADDVNSLYGCAPEAYTHLIESVDKYTGDARQPALTYDGVGRASSGSFLDSIIMDTPGGIVHQVAVHHDAHVLRPKGPQRCEANYSSPLRAIYSWSCGENGSFIEDQHVIGVNLERSSLFNLAGVPVNNSRVLAFRANLASRTQEPNAANAGINAVTVNRRIFTIYLKYVRLARVFLNNVEVEQ